VAVQNGAFSIEREDHQKRGKMFQQEGKGNVKKKGTAEREKKKGKQLGGESAALSLKNESGKGILH